MSIESGLGTLLSCISFSTVVEVESDILGLFALKQEDGKGSLSHDRARCYKVSQEGTGCAGCVPTRAHRPGMEGVQNRKDWCILILYTYLSGKTVCFKERTIHMSVYTPSQEIALKPNSILSLMIH